MTNHPFVRTAFEKIEKEFDFLSEDKIDRLKQIIGQAVQQSSAPPKGKVAAKPKAEPKAEPKTKIVAKPATKLVAKSVGKQKADPAATAPPILTFLSEVERRREKLALTEAALLRNCGLDGATLRRIRSRSQRPGADFVRKLETGLNFRKGHLLKLVEQFPSNRAN